MAQLRIGISGWSYGGWRGVFYPRKLPQRLELRYAGQMFNSVEINGSFYSLQRPSSYREWYSLTPRGFVFAVKGGRYITHMRKLRNVRTPLANFFASGVLCLKERLGPILWQFPPNLGFNEAKFEEFFAMLPRDTSAAAKLSREHDERLKHGSWTKTDAKRPLRHAVEIRHNSFLDPAFIALLRRHNIALVYADAAGLFPYTEDVTADFIYIRLHGAEQLYASGYSAQQLDWWADRIRLWQSGRQPKDARLVSPKDPPRRRSRGVYVYFDNDAKVHAPFNALALAQRLGSAAKPTP